MSNNFSIRLVHEAKFMGMRLVDYVKQDGTARGTHLSLFDVQAFREHTGITKPYDDIIMADLGSFGDLVSTFNTPQARDLVGHVVSYLLTEHDTEAVGQVELSEVNLSYVQSVLPPYLPEPFKSNISMENDGSDYIGYARPDIVRFVKHYTAFCEKFKRQEIPNNISEYERRGLELAFNEAPKEEGMNADMFSRSLKEMKQLLKRGYKDYLILGFC